MKYILSIVMVVCLSCGSKTTSEQRAQKLIKDHLYETLHDYKSYEFVKFGKLDSTFTSVADEPAYATAGKTFDSLLKESEENLEQAKRYSSAYLYGNIGRKFLAKAERCHDMLAPIAVWLDSFKANFHGRFNGWSMTHSYRAKSLGGNLGISHDIYYFNIAIDSLLENRDNSRDDDHSINK